MTPITVEFQGSYYFLEPWTGSLLKRETPRESMDLVDPFQAMALYYVDNPYLMRPAVEPDNPGPMPWRARLMAKALTWLCKKGWFWLACKLSSIPLKCYDYTEDAIYAYRLLYPGKEQKDLCLPRALFARSATENFTDTACVIIGAFLPSVQMHAWVIDGTTNPDYYDEVWINYTPVGIL